MSSTKKLTKAEREEAKQNLLKQKEEKQRLLLEERERKAKEREEKKKLKLETQRIKDENNEKRLQEKQRKDEILEQKKRKSDLEKQEKLRLSEKQSQILEKQKAVLFGFLKQSQNERQSQQLESNNNNKNDNKNENRFLPFELAVNQTLAPILNNSIKLDFVSNKKSEFDCLLNDQNYDRNGLYLDSLKRVSNYKPFKFGSQSQPKCSQMPEIMIIEPNQTQNQNEKQKQTDTELTKTMKTKHLQFNENIRPPYCGTFTKSSKIINGRKPFGKDLDLFDYDMDSEQEWEEGGEGESLNGSDSDSDKAIDDNYEIDNQLFVPHGYLSDDENENENHSSNDDKSKPLLKEQVLMSERNRAFTQITPIIIGCVWQTNNTSNTNNKYIQMLQPFQRKPIQH